MNEDARLTQLSFEATQKIMWPLLRSRSEVSFHGYLDKRFVTIKSKCRARDFKVLVIITLMTSPIKRITHEYLPEDYLKLEFKDVEQKIKDAK